jgi:hypothetical protein
VSGEESFVSIFMNMNTWLRVLLYSIYPWRFLTSKKELIGMLLAENSFAF